MIFSNKMRWCIWAHVPVLDATPARRTTERRRPRLARQYLGFKNFLFELPSRLPLYIRKNNYKNFVILFTAGKSQTARRAMPATPIALCYPYIL